VDMSGDILLWVVQGFLKRGIKDQEQQDGTGDDPILDRSSPLNGYAGTYVVLQHQPAPSPLAILHTKYRARFFNRKGSMENRDNQKPQPLHRVPVSP